MLTSSPRKSGPSKVFLFKHH